ncbi:hypothetical protein Rhe02_04060 [Rhizocola hellebori]|uniref:Anti-sigma factor antagonist n=1 Tax=Rhizocola hellebori TaxID=1392758 RepID=A0A8J3Q2A9_9ACTN|nr:STAS domain-containing protein [Rhizocola hellebori]GIH02339.1 hypothetical protein Rhe02_04060 [Rhizocola hellebori]
MTDSSPSPFTCNTQTRAGVTLLRLAGELDLAAESTMNNAVAAVVAARPTAIIVDLTELGFLDSTGVRCLIVAKRDAEKAGIGLTVRGAKGIVEQVLTITGILPAFGEAGPASPQGQPTLNAASGGFLARLGRRAGWPRRNPSP